MKTRRVIETEFMNINVLGLKIEHNGTKGGDAGHGGFVSITLVNEGSTFMELNGVKTDGFNFTFRGDSERDTLISALHVIINELEKHKNV